MLERCGAKAWTGFSELKINSKYEGLFRFHIKADSLHLQLDINFVRN
jgi:hypothetical protein